MSTKLTVIQYCKWVMVCLWWEHLKFSSRKAKLKFSENEKITFLQVNRTMFLFSLHVTFRKDENGFKIGAVGVLYRVWLRKLLSPYCSLMSCWALTFPLRLIFHGINYFSSVLWRFQKWRVFVVERCPSSFREYSRWFNWVTIVN